MELIMRKALPHEAQIVNEILNNGKQLLAQADIPQWCEEYPNIDIVNADIAAGNEYVATNKLANTIVGALTLITTGETDYDTIKGEWLTQSHSSNPTYAVIHRCAIAQGSERQGIMYKMFKAAEDIAREAGCISMRVDTHHKNMRMFALTKKLGYTDCGEISIPPSQAKEADLTREAFEKLL